jgi:hypothetical protein
LGNTLPAWGQDGEFLSVERPREGSPPPGRSAGRSLTARFARRPWRAETTDPRPHGDAAASLDAHARGRKTTGDGKARCHRRGRARGSIRPDARPTTVRMASADGGRADRRAGGAGCALLPIRNHLADLASATVLRSPDRGISLAKPEDVGMVRRSTGWRERARRAPDRASVAAEQAAAEPATRCRAAGGRPARRPCARPPAANLRPPLHPDQFSSWLADRARLKSHRTAPPAPRGRFQPTRLRIVRRRPHAFVAARFRHHAIAKARGFGLLSLGASPSA